MATASKSIENSIDSSSQNIEESARGAVVEKTSSGRFSSEIYFRQVVPAEIPACFDIQQASYPKGEAASKSVLQYRQHFAEKYFRCACVVEDDDDNHDVEQIVGFISATRCRVFTAESASTHDATGPVLAIHSIVVDKQYRGRGIATAMLQNYVETMDSMPFDGVDRIVLLTKVDLLPFYLKTGFSVLGISDITDGNESWYHLERSKGEKIPCWVVDSFTDIPGDGNPAAVVLYPERFRDDDEKLNNWCRRVAREFNLSETAFVCRKNDSSRDEEVVKKLSTSEDVEVLEEYDIRYFTSNGTEVDLCGHATLAAAAVLFQRTGCTKLVFYANRDKLIMTPWKYRSGKRMQICMEFPCKGLVDVMKDKSVIVDMLLRAFPNLAGLLGPKEIIYAGVDEDNNDLMVEIPLGVLDAIGYDSICFSALDWDGYQRGVMLCSRNEANDDNEPDFVSRFFGPKVGINEDPVTGSAHCVSAPYFAKKLNKATLLAEQRSQRGGRIKCGVQDKCVALTGSAVITLSGNSFIPFE